MRRLWKCKRIVSPLLVAVGMVLTVGVVHAQLKATQAVYAWDITPSKYSNSMVTMPFNVWLPFWHQLEFEATGFDWASYFPYTDQNGVSIPYPGGCPVGSTTPWEGVMEYGLYHEDNSPAGALAFLSSRAWELVDCDRDGVYTPRNKVWDGADQEWTPPSDRTTILMDHQTLGDGLGGWLILDENEVVACTTGNCTSEIVTTIFVSLDMNCDGYVDDLRAGMGHTHYSKPPYYIDWAGVCFFAEALTAPPAPPVWAGNPQARISAGGGEKTVNFNIGGGTTPVKLTSFAGRSVEAGSQPVMLWVAMSVVGVGALGALAWTLRPGRR